MLDIGTRVKKLRTERQLTVRQLAARAGVSVSYVYAVESGKRGSNLSKLERIAQALDVSLTALWDEGRD
ncbi:helix-turn-helix domain-containing protein [Alicyclobacillus shizuokensis]|uniref:helix-turn-helix domain-containing protein n=1 Tax=Alicyclobacillus shizuokensis TaxID=392014 RepID=UPI00083487BE|nr:helix-turn-helix transcriptional regulator [Alicyclobacillus shizuokensis]MCL6626037.1 helix-turn-helix domain-containing protein [Alicyclobacillus shizuokensis]